MTALVWGTLQPVFVEAQTRVIPSAALSERYDTNVFFAPPKLLPPGQRTSDFISTVAGGVQLLHKSRDVEASLTGGADVNAYAYNNSLNYLSTTVNGYARLDDWVGQFAHGARLIISERFRYTPEPPGFITGVKSQVGDDPFARGIQGFRANTYSNTVSAKGSYPVFRDLALQGGYSFSLFRVGSFIAGSATGAAFFNTNVHSWSVGPSLSLTREDQIGLSYQQSLVSQSITSGTGPTFNFNTQEVFANYSTVMLAGWPVALRGGVTYLEPASLVFPTGGVTFSTNLERPTYVQLDLSRKATPSFFLVSGATISNVGQALITHRLSRLLTLRGSVNYSYSETVPARTVKFENLTALVGLNYMLTRTMAVDLSYNFTDFTIQQQLGLAYEVWRNVVAIQLTGHWN